MDQSEIIYLVVRFWFWRGNKSLKLEDGNQFQFFIQLIPVQIGLSVRRAILEVANFVKLLEFSNFKILNFSIFLDFLKCTVKCTVKW